MEERYAKAECPVVSNNSAHRHTPDVPMVLPELNPEHIEIIPSQRKRLGTKRGFIAVKPNCSLQGYVPALFPLSKFGVKMFWFALIKLFPEQEKRLIRGPRWSIT